MSNNGFLHTPGSGLADWNDLENKPSAPSNRFLGKGTSSTNDYIDITLNGINGNSDISNLYQSNPNGGNSTSMIDLVFDKESNPVSNKVTFRIGGFSSPAYKGGLLANEAPVNFPEGFTFKPNTVYTFTWCKDGFYLVNVQDAIEEPVRWEDIEDKPDFKELDFNEYDYGYCESTTNLTTKTVTTINNTFTLSEGSGVIVVFVNPVPTTSSLKLNVNSTGAYPIVLKNGEAIDSDTFVAGSCCLFKYENGSYVCYGDAGDLPIVPRFYDTEVFGSFTCGRKPGSSIGAMSFTMGLSTASGKFSHAEGREAVASGLLSFSHGYNTKATGDYSHAEGGGTTASGDYSHAGGTGATASGTNAFSYGSYTKASGSNSNAFGYYTEALKYQSAIGHYNDTSLATETTYTGGSSNLTTGTAFVVGNGQSSSKSNACRITYAGQVIGKSSYASTGADYAEYFEWKDGNLDKEDRRGYFVTLDGDQIVKAKAGDFILGIISGHPCVIGNFDEHYRKQYEMDEFGDYIYVDDEGNPCKGGFYKINPDYDSSQTYIPREDRPEWSAVGMMGKLRVHDDGSCQVNGYCRCNDQGKATASDRGYRVLQRINDHIIEVLFSMYASF